MNGRAPIKEGRSPSSFSPLKGAALTLLLLKWSALPALPPSK